MPDSPENENPKDREKLLRELKERLKEIEALKRALESGMKTPENEPRSTNEEHPLTSGQVREAVEELKVPPLELLQDQPTPKKIKKDASSAASE